MSPLFIGLSFEERSFFAKKLVRKELPTPPVPRSGIECRAKIIWLLVLSF